MFTVSLLASTLLLAQPAPDSPASDSPTPDSPPKPGQGASAKPADGGPMAAEDKPLSTEGGDPLPQSGIYEGYEPPFATQNFSLSQVLREAAASNVDVTLGEIDVEITEAQVLAALGAFDVFMTAGVNAQYNETPQRGSQFVFNLSQQIIGGSIGFNRRLETGGQIALDFGMSRALTAQANNPFDSSQGSTQLAAYSVTPSLTLTHSLLRGAGLKVNKADINKAKIATTQAEAAQLLQAQQIASELIQAYWDVLFAHRDLINKRRSVEVSRKQLERTQALVRAGRLSPVEAKAVEQGLASRESDVLVAENSLLDVSLTLRTLMGQEFADRDTLGVFPMTDPVVKPRPVDIRAEVERALQTNPQIRQVELSMASLRIDEMVAANNRLPTLDFQGTFAPSGRSIDTNADASTGDPGSQGNWGEAFRNMFNEQDAIRGEGLLADWSISGALSLTWDIQNRGPKGQHEAVKLQLKRSEWQLKQARQQVGSAVIRAANGLRTAAKVMDVAEISLELAIENLEAEQARFDVGRATNFDVLLRLDEVDAAASQALSAQVAYLKTLVQLQTLNGELLPSYGLVRQ